MDNIQFWVYLAFAAIYIISRVLKKKGPQQNSGKPRPGTSTNSNPPVSFEDLLKEFTEGSSGSSQEETAEERRPLRSEPVEAIEILKERKREERAQDFSAEGNDRHYSSFDDSEAKRVYEESIKRAEGADLKFERDEHFATGIRTSNASTSEVSVADEILEMLQDENGAKKAVILSEILNRKY